MKPRTVMVTVEMVTDMSLAGLKKFIQLALTCDSVAVRQVTPTVQQPAAKVSK